MAVSMRWTGGGAKHAAGGRETCEGLPKGAAHLEKGVMPAVQVGEDAVFILEPAEGGALGSSGSSGGQGAVCTREAAKHIIMVKCIIRGREQRPRGDATSPGGGHRSRGAVRGARAGQGVEDYLSCSCLRLLRPPRESILAIGVELVALCKDHVDAAAVCSPTRARRDASFCRYLSSPRLSFASRTRWQDGQTLWGIARR